jgi:hypothetical protein
VLGEILKILEDIAGGQATSSTLEYMGHLATPAQETVPVERKQPERIPAPDDHPREYKEQKIPLNTCGDFSLYPDGILEYNGSSVQLNSLKDLFNWMLANNGKTLTKDKLKTFGYRKRGTQDAIINRIRRAFKKLINKDPLEVLKGKQRGKGWIVNIS